MKKLLLAGVMALAMVGVGQAADMMLKAPPPAPVYSWTGWYLGANFGDAWSSSDNATFSGAGPSAILHSNVFPTTLSTSPSGLLGGLQTGYNWQLSPAWVIGAETDIQFSRFQGRVIGNPAPLPPFAPWTTQVNQESDWFGTLRARLGFLVTPTVLLYGTGGLAYGQADTSFSTTLTFFSSCPAGAPCTLGQASDIRTGWAGGGGVEWMLAPHWTLRGEYLYVDLGSQSVTASPFTPHGGLAVNSFTASSTYHENIVRAALNFGF
jgi:outer membrane immunogenic protein